LDFVALKTKLDVSAFVFDTQLNMVVFPVLVNPVIPQFNAMIFFYFLKIEKTKIDIKSLP